MRKPSNLLLIPLFAVSVVVACSVGNNQSGASRPSFRWIDAAGNTLPIAGQLPLNNLGTLSQATMTYFDGYGYIWGLSIASSGALFPMSSYGPVGGPGQVLDIFFTSNGCVGPAYLREDPGQGYILPSPNVTFLFQGAGVNQIFVQPSGPITTNTLPLLSEATATLGCRYTPGGPGPIKIAPALIPVPAPTPVSSTSTMRAVFD